MQSSGKYFKFYLMEMDLSRINLVEVKRQPDLRIRNYRPDDAAELVKVFNTVFSGTSDPFLPIAENDLENLPSDRIIIAEWNRKIVGFLMCGIREVEGEKVGIIGYVGVLNEYRRKGIATSLAIEAGKFFLNGRLKKVIAEVYYLNKDSYHFIEGFGFRETATIRVPSQEAARSLFRVKPQ